MKKDTFFNILSDERKEEIKRKKIFSAFQFQIFVTEGVLVLFCLFLIGIWQIIAYQTRSFQEMISGIKQSQSQYKELQSYEEKFAQINQKAVLVNDVLKNGQDFSGVIDRFGQLVPDLVRMEGITVRAKKLFARGKAESRDVLSDFQEALKSDECFADLSIPLESWVQKENPSFEMEINLSDACFKQ